MAELNHNDGFCSSVDGTQVSQENENPLIEIEMPDSPECYEYSSGSDRSNEAEDGDSSEGTPSKSNSCSRRMQRLRSGSHGSRRRHKGGSRHKKTFQPYPPQEETNLKRRSMERREKENAAAEVRQEVSQEFMKFPVAPFNSTQYLMDEHSVTSPANVHKTPSHSKMNSPSMDRMVSDELNQEASQADKKDKDFTDVYTSVHAESLQCLSKEELVKHYMSLEEKIASLQKQVKQSNNVTLTESSMPNDNFMDMGVIRKPSISVGEDSAQSSTSIAGNHKISVSS